jgi:hypothetical protein
MIEYYRAKYLKSLEKRYNSLRLRIRDNSSGICLFKLLFSSDKSLKPSSSENSTGIWPLKTIKTKKTNKQTNK